MTARSGRSAGLGGPGATPSADLVVVGAGVMGAWVALEGRRSGRTTTLIDAFGAGHARATLRLAADRRGHPDGQQKIEPSG